MKKFKYYLGLAFSLVVISAAAVGFTTQVVEATSATTYTHTVNADKKTIRCQDGYLPETTYDRIGLNSPQDMVIDKVTEGEEEVEYGYILNKGSSSDPTASILKFRLDGISNDEDGVTKIDLSSNLPYVSEPTGLWITTTTVNGKTQKELYIADGTASYTEVIKANEEEQELLLSDYTYTYKGLIYRIPFDESGNNLLFNKADWLHEPTQEAPRNDYSLYEVKTFENEKDFDDYQVISTNASNFKATNVDSAGNVISYNKVVCRVEGTCEDRIVPLGKFQMKTASYGQDTIFNPQKVAVDSAGNIFIASQGTSAGMIQLSYSGEFISFFVVNSVDYNFLYQFIKNFGTSDQLELLDAETPASFFNVFVDDLDLVYSVTQGGTKIFDKYSTAGSSILENAVSGTGTVSDAYVTDDGLIYLSVANGVIYVLAPTGQVIFWFGSEYSSSTSRPSVVGFFEQLEAIMVDDENRIWVIDSESNYLQTFTPTDYANSIFKAIISFKDHDYETSRSAWEEVLQYDSLSVLANDGLGKAYYYDLDFENSLKYFSTSKNRSLYSNVFWELRNDYLQDHLSAILVILIGVIIACVVLKILFKKNAKMKAFKEKTKSIKEKRWFKDLTVGFRLIKKPNDTFYEMKTHHRGSIWGATIYYILGIIAFLLNTYCYSLPFQYVTTNTMNPSTILAAVVIVLGVFVLCNYLVSAINDGEGTFADIYKFTGYSLLPMIICLPLAVGISYGLTLNEQVVLTILKAIGFWGTGIFLVIGILETHNYSFGQTVKNIFLTIIFMILFLIICMVVIIMLDQIKTFIETVWKEVKLRVGWY